MTLSKTDAGALLAMLRVETGSRSLEQFLRGLEEGDFVPDTPVVAVADANTTILATNSGKWHLVANVSADRTFTLPAPAEGLYFPFVAQVGAADGHDWIIDTGSDTNFFLGGVLHVDDAPAADGIHPDLNSNSKLQVNLPEGGTVVHLYCDGTNWTVWGTVVSAAAPAFADQ